MKGFKGKTVALKATFNSADRFPASTHPDTVATLVRSLKSAGAKKITLAERSGMGITEEVVRDLGITDLSSSLSFDVNILDRVPEEGWIRVKKPDNHWKRWSLFASIFRDADSIVQTCCLKTHRFEGHFTLSLKKNPSMTSDITSNWWHNLIRVLYVGDIEVFVLFLLPGTEVVPLVERVNDGSRHLKQALKDPEIEIKYVSPQAAPSDFPRTSEELAEYDVVILSDVGHDTLMLYPGEELYQIGRNRLKELRSFVEKGGGLAFCGGWLSYQGHFGHGRWYGTPVADMLPVEILPVPDDRVEAPEGAVSSIENPEHPILEGIPWGTCPVFLGYNKVGRLRQGATLLARINDDPLIAVWEYKKGRVMAFTSDPAPHWGSSFAKWEHYPRFWIRTVKWLAREI